MNKFIQEQPIHQQHILHLLYETLKKYPDGKYFLIQRKSPSFTPRDPDTQEPLREYFWLQGYAKSAKALVQKAILIQEGYCCYSVSEYGKAVLGLGRKDLVATEGMTTVLRIICGAPQIVLDNDDRLYDLPCETRNTYFPGLWCNDCAFSDCEEVKEEVSSGQE